MLSHGTNDCLHQRRSETIKHRKKVRWKCAFAEGAKFKNIFLQLQARHLPQKLPGVRPEYVCVTRTIVTTFYFRVPYEFSSKRLGRKFKGNSNSNNKRKAKAVTWNRFCDSKRLLVRYQMIFYCRCNGNFLN